MRSIEALADWQTLFNDIFIWCALARLDYEPEVLASGALTSYICSLILKPSKQHEPNAKILIVTGEPTPLR